MKRTILQIPISEELRRSAEKVSSEMGFSSIQETVRVFLTKLSKKEINIKIQDEEQLSPKAAARYEKMLKDMKTGKNVNTAESVADFLKQLNA